MDYDDAVPCRIFGCPRNSVDLQLCHQHGGVSPVRPPSEADRIRELEAALALAQGAWKQAETALAKAEAELHDQRDISDENLARAEKAEAERDESVKLLWDFAWNAYVHAFLLRIGAKP